MQKKRLTREERKEQTRRDIVQAAKEVFPLQGFEGTSIDRIVEAAGYTKGAFYAHFQDKAELFMAILREEMELWAEDLKTMVKEERPLREFIAGYARELQEALAGGQSWILLKMEFLLLGMRDETFRVPIQQHLRYVKHMLSEVIQTAYDRSGEATALPADALAEIFIAIDTGLSVSALLENGVVPSVDVERVFSLLSAGTVKTQ